MRHFTIIMQYYNILGSRLRAYGKQYQNPRASNDVGEMDIHQDVIS